ncbi:hypothetical protein TNCV_2123781 [Trichonephila clavipes]|nr:hypothetical protein TNCV_2123781 [Trichonephila clavipes]
MSTFRLACACAIAISKNSVMKPWYLSSQFTTAYPGPLFVFSTSSALSDNFKPSTFFERCDVIENSDISTNCKRLHKENRHSKRPSV